MLNFSDLQRFSFIHSNYATMSALDFELHIKRAFLYIYVTNIKFPLATIYLVCFSKPGPMSSCFEIKVEGNLSDQCEV